MISLSFVQAPTHLLRIRRRTLRHFDSDRFDPMSLGNVADAFAVRAVDDDQQLAVARNHRRNHRFDPERAAALEQNRLVAVCLADAGNAQQVLPNVAHDVNELGVPRSHVAQHRLFDGTAGCERSGSEQELVSFEASSISREYPGFEQEETEAVPLLCSLGCLLFKTIARSLREIGTMLRLLASRFRVGCGSAAPCSALLSGFHPRCESLFKLHIDRFHLIGRQRFKDAETNGGL